MKSKINMFVMALIILSMLLGACAPAAATAPAGGTDGSAKVKINIALMPFLSNTVFTIAQKQGYFAEQNLDVTFTQLPNSNDLVALLVAGKVDVGAPGPSAGLFTAIAKGGNIKIILPLSDFVVKSCSIAAYVARTADVKAGTYANKADWAKARMVLSNQGLNGIVGYVFSKTLDGSGLGIDGVKLQNVDIPAQEDALRKGQVDIVYAVEPAITRMTAKGDISVLDTAEHYASPFTSSMVVVGKNILDNPDVAKRFSIAYLKAVRQFLKGSADDGNVAAAAELSKLSPDLVKKLCWSSVSPDGIMNVQSQVDFQNWMVQRKLLDQVVPAEKFYDPSFAAAAVQVIGSQKP